MDSIVSQIPLFWLMIAFAVAFVAGTVKGIVGFAMPMIMISGFSSFLSPELALASLILPTVATNTMQALRHGFRAAFKSMVRFKVFLGTCLIFLMISAQFVNIIPSDVLLLMIGVPVTAYGISQLAGYPLRISSANANKWEFPLGAVAGFMGGFSGVWGPPTVAYLTAIETEKTEQMRVQGVIYGIGAYSLVGAHIGSGILTAQTSMISALMVVPAMLGMWMGGRIQDRIDQQKFKTLTLIVLVVAGLNLIRRGIFA